MKVLVNLGYGSITNGWSAGPANVPTPFGLFPTNINPVKVLAALAKGALQGLANAINDLKTPNLFDTSGLSLFLAGLHTIGDTPSNTPTLLQLAAAFAAIDNAGVPVSASGGILNTIGSVVSGDIAVAQAARLTPPWPSEPVSPNTTPSCSVANSRPVTSSTRSGCRSRLISG